LADAIVAMQRVGLAPAEFFYRVSLLVQPGKLDYPFARMHVVNKTVVFFTAAETGRLS
jgi:hypothetical protein